MFLVVTFHFHTDFDANSCPLRQRADGIHWIFCSFWDRISACGSNSSLGLCPQEHAVVVRSVLSPSSNCSGFTGLSAELRLLLEFPSRSGSEADMDTTAGLLLHFNTDGNSSTNSSEAGNSSCEEERTKPMNQATLSSGHCVEAPKHDQLFLNVVHQWRAETLSPAP